MHHFHVYYNEDTKQAALDLYALLKDSYPDLHLGRMHDRAVGPHPMGSFEVDVPVTSYDHIYNFLQENHDNLTVMIHPVTGNDIEDHKEENIKWIGQPQEIDRSIFQPRWPSSSYRKLNL